jgi:Xaa-Pro aminopeptidase
MTMPGHTKDLGASRARLRTVMDEQDLSAVVLSSYQAVSYFAGTNILTQVTLPDRLAYLLCLEDGSATLVLCSIETSMARSQTDVADIVEYTEFVDDPTTVLGGLLEARGLAGARIGVEGRRMHARSADILRDRMPALELVYVDTTVESLQVVKTTSEVEMLRQAGRRTLDAVLAGVARTDPGDSEQSLCAIIGSGMYNSGGMPVFTFFSTGARALGAHVEPIDRPLTEGELWRIDLGGRFYELINSDLARTGVVGDPVPEQEDILQHLLACQAAGFAALEPGRPASDVFDAVRAEFDRRGMAFAMPHVGHGIGIGIHEFPILEPANKAPLAVGTVVNVEPMFKSTARGECYHVEDLAVVTEDGYELLTPPQSGLLRIGA